MEDMANGAPEDPVTCRHPELGSADHTEAAETGDQYAARHNPFVYFHSIIDTPQCDRSVVDFGELGGDLRHPARTPDFSFISPNLCSDGHDDPCVQAPDKPGGIPRIEAWLKQEVPAILGSDAYADKGLLVVTFDEAEDDSSSCCHERSGPNTLAPGIGGPGGGRIGAVLLSPCITPGTRVKASFNHYGLLRSVEKLFGLPYLGYAGQAGLRSFNRKIFNRKPCRAP
jgi:hypothetical protein